MCLCHLVPSSFSVLDRFSVSLPCWPPCELPTMHRIKGGWHIPCCMCLVHSFRFHSVAVLFAVTRNFGSLLIMFSYLLYYKSRCQLFLRLIARSFTTWACESWGHAFLKKGLDEASCRNSEKKLQNEQHPRYWGSRMVSPISKVDQVWPCACPPGPFQTLRRPRVKCF